MEVTIITFKDWCKLQNGVKFVHIILESKMVLIKCLKYKPVSAYFMFWKHLFIDIVRPVTRDRFLIKLHYGWLRIR